ncbi:hypothetical protein [Desulforhopalus sp. IMCC35007]|uniref:hypothetical protein n=1 Tax=Desulforhopalus sp. IMCC35007 TaxID=2569543 RepID=UPI0010AECBCD|nr:hypothetical protein [Desulforhopalus sp. IMCC35007]TKB07772.1 hypothetical protein FCL48_15590 [Desulforhopalus sp. IMCC35007]
MVRGLDRFKAHFEGYEANYVLIGGTAASLAMDEAGLQFRATADLDIVLCVEALDLDFVRKFWEFVQAGNYQNRQKSIRERQFYRFYDPEDHRFPEMLELFSKRPDALAYEGEGHLTPIPMGEEVSSLSAILLDESYYEFLHAGKQELDGLSVLGPEYIIPLKARAWLDLTARKEQGDSVDSRDIKKHKNDVFRLYLIVSQDTRVEMSDQVIADMSRFVLAMAAETIDLRQLGHRRGTPEQVLENLRSIYGLAGK